MFESLSQKLDRAFKNIRGQGKLTEKNMKDSLQEIRTALLEADVNYKVVKKFISDVQDAAVGEKVFDSVQPGGTCDIRICIESQVCTPVPHGANASPVIRPVWPMWSRVTSIW